MPGKPQPYDTFRGLIRDELKDHIKRDIIKLDVADGALAKLEARAKAEEADGRPKLQEEVAAFRKRWEVENQAGAGATREGKIKKLEEEYNKEFKAILDKENKRVQDNLDAAKAGADAAIIATAEAAQKNFATQEKEISVALAHEIKDQKDEHSKDEQIINAAFSTARRKQSLKLVHEHMEDTRSTMQKAVDKIARKKRTTRAGLSSDDLKELEDKTYQLPSGTKVIKEGNNLDWEIGGFQTAGRKRRDAANIATMVGAMQNVTRVKIHATRPKYEYNHMSKKTEYSGEENDEKALSELWRRMKLEGKEVEVENGSAARRRWEPSMKDKEWLQKALIQKSCEGIENTELRNALKISLPSQLTPVQVQAINQLDFGPARDLKPQKKEVLDREIENLRLQKVREILNGVGNGLSDSWADNLTISPSNLEKLVGESNVATTTNITAAKTFLRITHEKIAPFHQEVKDLEPTIFNKDLTINPALTPQQAQTAIDKMNALELLIQQQLQNLQEFREKMALAKPEELDKLHELEKEMIEEIKRSTDLLDRTLIAIGTTARQNLVKPRPAGDAKEGIEKLKIWKEDTKWEKEQKEWTPVSKEVDKIRGNLDNAKVEARKVAIHQPEATRPIFR